MADDPGLAGPAGDAGMDDDAPIPLDAPAPGVRGAAAPGAPGPGVRGASGPNAPAPNSPAPRARPDSGPAPEAVVQAFPPPVALDADQTLIERPAMPMPTPLPARLDEMIAADAAVGDATILGAGPRSRGAAGGAGAVGGASGGRLTPATARTLTDPLIGKTIGGAAISAFVGEGGMGRVYLGTIGDPPKRVAVKILSRGFNNPEAVGRFEREAKILERLQHPGIAGIVGHGIWDDGSGGIPYMLIEFVEQARELADFATANKLDLRGRLELFHRACEAISFAHEMKILHRDLKPANLLVDKWGRVKVIDFGVARAANGDLGIAGVRTETGQLIGTVQYMSPEQIGGDPRAIDLRSDVYALGVIMYEMLLDAHPYDVRGLPLHEAARVVTSAKVEPPRSVDPTIDEELEKIVMTCLERDRMRRYEHAGAVAKALEHYLSGPSRGLTGPRGGAVVAAGAAQAPAGGSAGHAGGSRVGPGDQDELVDLDEGVLAPLGAASAPVRTAPKSSPSRAPRPPSKRSPRAGGTGGGSSRGGWGLVIAAIVLVAIGGLISLGVVDLRTVRKWLPGSLGGTMSPASASAAATAVAEGAGTSTESLTIVSAPDGAAVSIDGEPQGRTPLSLMITWSSSSPRKTVEVAANGYDGAAAIVMPDPAGRRAEPLRLSFNLQPRSSFKETTLERLVPLLIEGGPVEVRVEGAPAVRLDPGRRDVRLSLPRQGGQWGSRRVTFVAPERKLEAFGRRGSGTLSIDLAFAEISDQPQSVRVTP